MLCGHTLRCTHTTCFVVTHWDLHVCPHIMSPACHPLPYSFFHHSSPFLHEHFLGIENKIPEKQKSSQIFIVWHTMTGGVIGAPIIREVDCSVCVRTEGPVQPILYLSFSKPYQLSSKDPRVINSWLISRMVYNVYYESRKRELKWSYQQLIDK